MKFTALLHHLTVDLLRESFYSLKRKAAPGVDAEFASAQGCRVRRGGGDGSSIFTDGLIVERIERCPRGECTYRKKMGGNVHWRSRPWKTRSSNRLWSPSSIRFTRKTFWDSRMGFARGIAQHDALDALSYALLKKKVNYILDADIKGFLDNLKKTEGRIVKFMEHRVADPRILRLIRKWLKAGVMEDGQWSEPQTSTPQGSVVSPLLANVYLHYSFDLWVNVWRQKWAQGEVVVTRYADDTILGFQYQTDADRFLENLRERLAKFGLELHPDKTHRVKNGSLAEENRRRKEGEGKPETFDFLGFTHISGKNSLGRFMVRRKTIRKRIRGKLRKIKQQLRMRMHDPLPQTGRWLQSVVQGHFNYYAVPGNLASLGAFRDRVLALWWRTLRRREPETPDLVDAYSCLGSALASSTEHASSLSGCPLCRHPSEIRTGCANERSSGSEEGVVSNHDPLSDQQPFFSKRPPTPRLSLTCPSLPT